MGSMVHLALGPFEVDWGKNDTLMLHGQLYQPGDVTMVADVYVDENDKHITRMQTGTSKPLVKVLPRLELLGFTLETARAEFESIVKANGYDNLAASFDDFADMLAKMDVDTAACAYHKDYDLGGLFAREISHRSKSKEGSDDDVGSRYDWEELMSRLNPYVMLRLLAENPTNLARPVSWHYHDVVDNGWVPQQTIDRSIGAVRRFLIVTEGSSDTLIIRKALELLRPEITDFFSFVDMREGYPFTGTGNLHKFSQGLVAIGIENQVIVLYDNDEAGSTGFRETSGLQLPPNMRVVKLPDLPQLAAFRTTGPNGDGVDDINGRAAAIECYLDLEFRRTGRDQDPHVKWAVDNGGRETRQGALVYKDSYKKRFLNLRAHEEAYDFSKIAAVLENIVVISVSMAVASRLAQTGSNSDVTHETI
jgi:hypothetical protein